MKNYISEFIGTFAMIFCGTGAMTINEITGGDVTHVGIGITWGLIVMAMIYAFGEISGAHFNPAVSIAFAYAKKFSWKEVPKYIFFQVAGAFAASLVLMWLFPKSELLGATIPTVDVWRAFVLELILTFFLMVVIINVSTGSKEAGMMAGIAIGSVVLLEALFAGPITNASMNPARSLAPNIVSGNIKGLWLYILAPIIGALLAVVSCKFVKHENCCDEEC
ncbi:MIP family channel protein [Flavobacteriaceae bacterium]|jgi:aquaporin NIP|nr:MIP family channel protein [Flavobacteriaceae bacterium]MDB2490846.1 MIP family channel protein [Flavobacteriaceae bacterium]MDB2625017.1 MIP family channel protein [Flavobacteriaceae bacterium]MDB2657644.1 MIP family channel protein [Flavobacteriaceae bacterium]MDB2674371.1 MIP family channel protein [Flavobacteriaceae bacterium]|tara:strand:+ start:620 stop:1282 length:663 start_codon:yes stop_codon:yes gene_type:complete